MDIKEMQKIWDAALVRGWHDDIKLSQVLYRFVSELRFLGLSVPEKGKDALETYGLYNDYVLEHNLLHGADFKGKRVRVRVFMASYLSPISEMLWNEKTDLQVLNALSRMPNQLKQNADRDLHNVRRNMHKENRIAKTQSALYKEAVDERNWKRVKPVRAK